MSIAGFDQHTNFAYSTVQAGSGVIGSGTATTVTIASSGDLPDPALGPYNIVVWPASLQPLISNAEIMRVTAKSGATLTVTRAQEGTTALTSIASGYQVAQNITRKFFADIEAVLPGPLFAIPSQLKNQPYPAMKTATFTPTFSVTPGSGAIGLLNDGAINYGSTGISGNQTLQVWDSYTNQITSPPIGSSYVTPTWINSDYGPLWNGTTPTIVLDMGSAKLPTAGIFFWGCTFSTSAVAAPNHVKLESADDSGMSVNLATILDVAIAAFSGTGFLYCCMMRVDPAATPRRYWRITLTRSNTFASISEIIWV